MAAAAATTATPMAGDGALRLPIVLGHVGQLALAVVEAAAGEPLDDALAREGSAVAAALGRAIGRIGVSLGDPGWISLPPLTARARPSRWPVVLLCRAHEGGFFRAIEIS